VPPFNQQSLSTTIINPSEVSFLLQWSTVNRDNTNKFLHPKRNSWTGSVIFSWMFCSADIDASSILRQFCLSMLPSYCCKFRMAAENRKWQQLKRRVHYLKNPTSCTDYIGLTMKITLSSRMRTMRHWKKYDVREPEVLVSQAPFKINCKFQHTKWNFRPLSFELTTHLQWPTTPCTRAYKMVEMMKAQ
jgi:hypothetical protein